MTTLTEVQLRINVPATQETTFAAVGAQTSVSVTLTGEVLSSGHGTLYLKWYSSLESELAFTQMLESDPRTWTIAPALPVGSHIITLTAQDKSDQGLDPADLGDLYKSMEHIGSAGGPPPPLPLTGAPRIVHVLVANMVSPAPSTLTLSKSTPLLEAQAPLQWATYPAYTDKDPDYHAVNRVQYRWFFRPVATPPSSNVELDLAGDTLLQLMPPAAADEVPRLRYTGSLPDSLVTVGNSYIVTLRVQELGTAALGHEVSRAVTIIA
jgi:hypothetical protein